MGNETTGQSGSLDSGAVVSDLDDGASQPVVPESADHRSSPDLPLERILEPVRSYWGFDSLRPLQEEAIRATLGGRDSVVVMPTGGGKSLCYQVPPVVAKRTDIVVSPLISLMKDQVDGLRACGYPAAAIHSGLPSAENHQTLQDLRDGRFRLIFVSPERLLMPGFLRLIEQLDLRSFAIDEAHCISQWGHDFRPEYRRMALIKERFPQVSVHAYTATATERVREDIAVQLGLADPVRLVGTFDRPNLIYRIVPRFDVYQQAIDVVRRHGQEGTIVYCLSRNDTEAMADALRHAGIDARAYHAGLDSDDRRRTQEAFAAESLNVVAATVAFGMGIDRSNVRCIIHATMPKSIEHYQQETGRSGRDGLEAECVLLYSPADAMRWQSLIARSAAEAEDPAQVIAAQSALIEEMRRYCTVPQCRHRMLSEHFGQSYPKSDCEACDVCLDEMEGMEEATEVAQKILSCVARVQRHGGTSFGVGHTVDVLLGAGTEAIRRRGHDQVSTYGLLKGTPKKTLTNWVYQLVDQGLLQRTIDDHPVLHLNEASLEVMRGQRNVQMIRAATKTAKRTRAEASSWEGVDRGLFDHLRGVRHELAEERGVPAFVVFSDRTLRDMARLRPIDVLTMKRVHGVGDAKVAKFGLRFAGEIQSYCREHGIEVAEVVEHFEDDESLSEPKPAGSRKARQSCAKLVALDMFARGDSIEEVMVAVSRSRGSVMGYLCEFIEASRPESIERWVDAQTYHAVADAASQVGDERLKPIHKQLDEEVPYDDIRLVLAHLEARRD